MLYTLPIRRALQQARLVADAEKPPDRAADWEVGLHKFHHKAIGLALLKVQEPGVVLSSCEKIQMEYFMFP